MIVSEARRAANRRNALKSTGPKTAAGKEVVRRNALKHGLTAVVVPVEEEAAAVAERAAGLVQSVGPGNPWQAWVVGELAQVSVRLDRLGRVERQVREEACWRALTCWDVDQRDEVERVAARLSKDPGRVVGWLRRSPQGCDWLIERWAMLASVADRHPWTAEQVRLAYDLLGTPVEVRGDAPERVIDAEGVAVGPERSAAAVARAMIADLEVQRERVIEADEIARARAQGDNDEFGNRDLVRLRRYERELHARLRWCWDRLHEEAPVAGMHLDLRPGLAEPAAPVDAETKPTAVVIDDPNKATATAEAAETKPLAGGAAPIPADALPSSIGARRSRPLTSFELWTWERAEGDRIRGGLNSGAWILTLSVGKRGPSSGDSRADPGCDQDAEIPRRRCKSGLDGSSLAAR